MSLGPTLAHLVSEAQSLRRATPKYRTRSSLAAEWWPFFSGAPTSGPPLLLGRSGGGTGDLDTERTRPSRQCQKAVHAETFTLPVLLFFFPSPAAAGRCFFVHLGVKLPIGRRRCVAGEGHGFTSEERKWWAEESSGSSASSKVKVSRRSEDTGLRLLLFWSLLKSGPHRHRPRSIESTSSLVSSGPLLSAVPGDERESKSVVSSTRSRMHRDARELAQPTD